MKTSTRILAVAAASALAFSLGGTPAAAATPEAPTVSTVASVNTPVIMGVSSFDCMRQGKVRVCQPYQWWDYFEWFPGKYCVCYG